MGASLGASFNAARSRIEQSSNIQLLSRNETGCTSYTSNVISNYGLNISGSSIQDITIAQSGTSSADCIINNNITAVSSQLFDALQNTTAASDRGGILNVGVQVDLSSSTTVTDIEAAIETSIRNLCSAETSNLATNFNWNISNSSVGNITISQNADAASSCVISNLSYLNAYSQQMIQQNTNAGGKRDGAIIGLVIFVVIVVAVISLLGALLGGFGKTKTEEAGCLPYPCDLKSGADYVQCAKDIPFDPTLYCPPMIPTAAPLPAAPIGVASSPPPAPATGPLSAPLAPLPVS